MIKEISTNNYGGLLIINQGEMLDVTYLLPNTDKSEDYIPKMQMLNTEYQDDESESSRRMLGMIKWAIQTGIEGERNSTLYSLGKFAQDIGLEPATYIHKVNSMLQLPLPERDIAQILRSIG